MLNTCANRGAEKTAKGLTYHKHYSCVVNGKKIQTEGINKYNNANDTFHAEECALKRPFREERKDRQRSPSLQGNESLLF